MLHQLLGQIPDVKIPAEAKGLLSNPVVLGVGVLVVVGLLVMVYRFVFGKKAPDLEARIRENLSQFPPPPKLKDGTWQLVFSGEPVRVRLIVMAPMGRTELTDDDVVDILDSLYRGLGHVVSTDKPKVRLWPTQLSAVGFTPTFNRVTIAPDNNRWILASGPANAGNRKILLGLALLADDDTDLRLITVKPEQWPELLRLERV